MSRSDQKSSSEAERNVVDARTELQNTIEELQERLAPGALFEDALAYFSGDGRRYADTILHEAKLNPFPVMLIGIGLAWLAIGSGRRVVGPDQDQDWRRRDLDGRRDRERVAPITSEGSSLSDGATHGAVGPETRPDIGGSDRVEEPAVRMVDLRDKPKPDTADQGANVEDAGTGLAAGTGKPCVDTSESGEPGTDGISSSADKTSPDAPDAPFDPSGPDTDSRKHGDPVVTPIDTDDDSIGNRKKSAKDAKT